MSLILSLVCTLNHIHTFKAINKLSNQQKFSRSFDLITTTDFVKAKKDHNVIITELPSCIHERIKCQASQFKVNDWASRPQQVPGQDKLCMLPCACFSKSNGIARFGHLQTFYQKLCLIALGIIF